MTALVFNIIVVRKMVVSGLLMLGLLQSRAQDNFTSFFEPEIEINYNVSSMYSQSFGIENRNFIYDDDDLGYTVKQIDISHFSEFRLKNNQSLAVGIQYRFENNFNTLEENELRMMQELQWDKVASGYTISNRLRNEQRLYASTTKYRLRYEFAFTVPLTSTTYLKTETEALFELAKTQKPELEQRISSVYGFTLFPKYSLELGAQYRLADYTQDLGHELFIVIGVEVDLN